MTRISKDCEELLLITSAAKITLNFSTFEQLYNASEDNKRLNLDIIDTTKFTHGQAAGTSENQFANL